MVVLLLLAGSILAGTGLAVLHSGRVLWGVSAPGIALGGLTQEEAKSKLAEHFQTSIATSPIIYVLAPGKRYAILPEDIDLRLAAEETALEAVQTGRRGSVFKIVSEQVTVLCKGVQIPYRFQYDDKKLAKLLTDICNKTQQEAKSAYCSLEGKSVQIHPEINGIKPNIEKLRQDCAPEKICTQVPLTVELAIETEIPAVSAAALSEVDVLLATYASSFNAANFNRSENIRLAADSLNQMLIEPGKAVSFNERVGLRVAEAGFKEAPVLIDGKSVPDIGGGVCQVSSTLYNAILLADLKPINRSPHFHPLGYVPIGFDATVADHLIDFVFENSLSHSIYILTSIENGRITVSILGNKANQGTADIKLVSTVDRIISPSIVRLPDPTLAAGTQKTEEGQEGYVVSSYRVKTENGHETARELLYVDTYNTEDTIVRIGTKR